MTVQGRRQRRPLLFLPGGIRLSYVKQREIEREKMRPVEVPVGAARASFWKEGMRGQGLICLLLSLVTLAVFLPVARHEFINYDDPDYVTRNAMVLNGLSWHGAVWAFTSGAAGNWHPFTWLSHMLDVQLFGLWAGGHHLINVLFHIANTLALFLILNGMTRALWRSALVAALFALHPLHVESVAWVSERKDVLSAFFFLLTLWAYTRYAQSLRSAARSTLHAPAFYALALFFFTLGLMSKPMLVTLPFVLLLLDYWPLGRIQVSSPFVIRHLSSLIREKLPFFALAMASSIVTFVVQQKGGAVASAEQLPVPLRLANALVAYFRYLGKAVWPDHLAVFYPHPGYWPWWQVVGAALVLGAMSTLVIAVGRRQPALLVGWLWFVGMLVPVIGLVQVGLQSMADRYSYLPLIGLFILLVWAVPEGWLNRKAFVFGTAALLAAGAAATFQQVRVWRTAESLFRHATAVTQKNYLAYHNLGSALARMDQADEATRCFEMALAIRSNYPDAQYDLGVIAARRGEWDEAVARYRAALQLKPKFPEAHNNLGNVLSELGRKDEAARHFAAAVQFKPDFPEALNNLANVEAAQGNLAEAIRHYERVVWLRPKHPEAYCNLGLALDRLGKQEEAVASFRRALKCDANHVGARLDLGVELSKLARPSEAAAEFRTVLEQQPENVEAHFHLANVLALQEKWDEAARQYREVLRRQPTHPDAHNNLAQVLGHQANWAEAAQHFAEALRERPEDTALLNDMGSALAHLRRFAEAAACYTNSLALSPNQVDVEFNLGNVLMKAGRRAEALAHYESVLRRQPSHAEARYQGGVVLAEQKQFAAAIEQWQAALKLRPDWPAALNNLAWLYATQSDPRLRNGPEAERLAVRALALSGTNRAAALDTLAAAQAAQGQFAQAAQTAQQAIESALVSKQPQLARQIAARLELYRQQQPYRE
jgi:protein O-mannosyl-transferase